MRNATEMVLAAGAMPPLPTALVAANTPLALAGAKGAAEQGLIVPILVGDPAQIRTAADSLDWDITGLKVVAADSEIAAAETAVRLAREGTVHALMKGHVHTDVLLRAVLNKQHGLRRGRRLTHVFHMSMGALPRPILISDAAINVAPDYDTLRDLTLNAIDLARAVGVPVPKVAILSATEIASDAVPSSQQAAELASELHRMLDGRADVAGPLALDNAVSSEAARIKGITGPVAGQADVLVVPTIEAGNMLFKALVQFAGAVAAGVVIGAGVPIMLTSRADSAEARLASAALAKLAVTGSAPTSAGD
jgi:phosphotransacetylase